MDTRTLPPEPRMRQAFMNGDGTWDGIFWAGVRSTGIFCRPSCPARKPRPRQLAFFATPADAVEAGFRACLRCRPLEPVGAPPDWLRPLLDAVESDPTRRWTEEDLRRLGLAPDRVRRWFKKTHGMTFQAYHRARRLGGALEEVRDGRAVSRAAFEAGYDSLSGFQEAFRQTFGVAPTELGNALVIRVEHVPTPLGPMAVAGSERGIHLLEFTDRRHLERQIRRTAKLLQAVFVPGASVWSERVREALEAYFEGDAALLPGLATEPAGTPFQREVWGRLASIPVGETRSYGEVASALGRPTAVRAVGAAVGANPLAIVVPCHRVVGADGRLTGFAGGLWRKRRLLELERRKEAVRG